MTLRVYLTGRVCVEMDGEVVIDEPQFRSRQGRLAFAYLAAEQTRPIPREELARALWAGEMASTWEASLSSLISRLRSLLASEALQGRGLSLSGGSGQYQLLLPADSWTDLEAASTAVDEAEGALRTGDPHRILGPATVAANITRRPFLSGAEGDWVEAQRRKLGRQLLRALDCLSHMWLALDEPSLALETATEAVAVDSYRERSYQLLMRAYVQGGNKARAIDVYHSLREILSRDLGTSPSVETEALYVRALD